MARLFEIAWFAIICFEMLPKQVLANQSYSSKKENLIPNGLSSQTSYTHLCFYVEANLDTRHPSNPQQSPFPTKIASHSPTRSLASHRPKKKKKKEWSYTLIKLSDGDEVYQSRSQERLIWPYSDIKISDLEIDPTPIPKAHRFPLYLDEDKLTKAPNPLPGTLYEKQMQLALYDHPPCVLHD